MFLDLAQRHHETDHLDALPSNFLMKSGIGVSPRYTSSFSGYQREPRIRESS